MKPILAFRVKPDPKRTYYFRVEVYRTIHDLRKAPHPLLGGVKGFSRMLGACFGFRTALPCGRLSPQLGLIRFVKSRLGVGVVSHEVFHATMRFLAQLEIRLPEPQRGEHDWVSEREELACRAQQNMMCQIYDRVYRAELVKP